MDSDRLLHAAIGAVVTIITSFIPLSPILGGGVAAWLATTDRSDSAKLGGISGAIASLVFVPLLLFGLAVAIFDLGVTLLFFGLISLLGAGYLIGFSMIGGYLAAVLKESSDDESPAEEHTDAIETLQQRYAAGKISEREFEQKVEQVLETKKLDREIEELKTERER